METGLMKKQILMTVILSLLTVNAFGGEGGGSVGGKNGKSGMMLASTGADSSSSLLKSPGERMREYDLLERSVTSNSTQAEKDWAVEYFLPYEIELYPLLEGSFQSSSIRDDLLAIRKYSPDALSLADLFGQEGKTEERLQNLSKIYGKEILKKDFNPSGHADDLAKDWEQLSVDQCRDSMSNMARRNMRYSTRHELSSYLLDKCDRSIYRNKSVHACVNFIVENVNPTAYRRYVLLGYAVDYLFNQCLFYPAMRTEQVQSCMANVIGVEEQTGKAQRKCLKEFYTSDKVAASSMPKVQKFVSGGQSADDSRVATGQSDKSTKTAPVNGTKSAEPVSAQKAI